MLQSKLNSLDFSLLLPDVSAIADEVDGQLTESMDGYMELSQARADDRGSHETLVHERAGGRAPVQNQPQPRRLH
jgi:hypothetical protein